MIITYLFTNIYYYQGWLDKFKTKSRKHRDLILHL